MRRFICCLIIVGLSCLLLATGAQAASSCQSGISNRTVDQQASPAVVGIITPSKIEQIASSASVVRQLKNVSRIIPHEFGPRCWQVSYFSGHNEVAKVSVNTETQRVSQALDAVQIPWLLARGDSQRYGGQANAWYVFIPLCLLSIGIFFERRRIRQWAHIDLLVIVALAISSYFFNKGHIGVSVWFIYAVLVYLAGRMISFARRPRPWLSSSWSTLTLLVTLLFAIGFRIGLNIVNHSVIDIGWASVVGANRLLHGELLYGHFPKPIAAGDVYGPITYLAYIPFDLIHQWNGITDQPVAAHYAAICLDLAVTAVLALIGWNWHQDARPQRQRRALLLALAWTVNPYSTLNLVLNTNDALMALGLLLIVMALNHPLRRGAALGLVIMTKFAPIALIPLLFRETSWRRRGCYIFGLALGISVSLPVILHSGIGTFYHHTLAEQAGRSSPFTPWGQGQVPHLIFLRYIFITATVIGGCCLVYRQPGARLQTIAVMAALMIGVELTLNYWYYNYIVWFLPLVLLVWICHGEEFSRTAPTATPRPYKLALPRPVLISLGALALLITAVSVQMLYQIRNFENSYTQIEAAVVILAIVAFGMIRYKGWLSQSSLNPARQAVWATGAVFVLCLVAGGVFFAFGLAYINLGPGGIHGICNLCFVSGQPNDLSTWWLMINSGLLLTIAGIVLLALKRQKQLLDPVTIVVNEQFHSGAH